METHCMSMTPYRNGTLWASRSELSALKVYLVVDDRDTMDTMLIEMVNPFNKHRMPAEPRRTYRVRYWTMYDLKMKRIA